MFQVQGANWVGSVGCLEQWQGKLKDGEVPALPHALDGFLPSCCRKQQNAGSRDQEKSLKRKTNSHRVYLHCWVTCILRCILSVFIVVVSLVIRNHLCAELLKKYLRIFITEWLNESVNNTFMDGSLSFWKHPVWNPISCEWAMGSGIKGEKLIWVLKYPLLPLHWCFAFAIQIALIRCKHVNCRQRRWSDHLGLNSRDSPTVRWQNGTGLRSRQAICNQKWKKIALRLEGGLEE